MKRQRLKRQRYPASIIKVGAVLYEAISTEGEGAVRIKIHRWVVRSIQKKRGSQSGSLSGLFQDNAPYVNLTDQILHLTWGKLSRKNGDFGWLKSIPSSCRKQFRVGDDLPLGLYTTERAALKYGLVNAQRRVDWYERELNAGVPEDELADYQQELADCKRVVAAIKTRLNKAR